MFEAEAVSLSISESNEFEEERDSIMEKASTLKQLMLQPEWSRGDVEESLEDLRMAHSALKAKVNNNKIDNSSSI